MNASIMKRLFESLKSCHWGWFILLWSFIQIFLIWFNQTYNMSYENLEQTLGNQFSPVQIDLYLAILQEVTFKVYFLLPALIFFRISVMTLIVHLFLLLSNRYISFNTLLWVSSLIFSVFIIRDIVQMTAVSGNGSADQNFAQGFYMPLSLLSVLRFNVNPVFHRLLNQMNLFEILWIGLTIFVLSKVSQYSPGKLLIPFFSARVFSIICLWGLGVFYEIYVL